MESNKKDEKRGMNIGEKKITENVSRTPEENSDYCQNVREQNVISSAPARMDRSYMESPAFVSEENISFWTQCSNCAAHHEYQRIYLNKTLFCRICRHVFVAKEMPPPSSVTSSRKEPAPAVKHHIQWDSSSRMFGYSNTINSTTQAASVVQQAQDKRKGVFEESRERDDDVEGFTNSDPRNFKRLKTDGSLMHGPLGDKTLSQTGASGSSTPNVDGESQENVDPERVKNCLRNFLASLAQTRAARNAVKEKGSESKKGKGKD